MEQQSKSWFPFKFVKFDFAKYEVERAAMVELSDFVIREAILDHLQSMFNARCPGEDCLEKIFSEQEWEYSECKSCPDNCFQTSHTSDRGTLFCVETWPRERRTFVSLL